MNKKKKIEVLRKLFRNSNADFEFQNVAQSPLSRRVALNKMHQLRKSNRTQNGLLKIKCKDKACPLYEPFKN